ncbi:MAG: hypothetical protein A2836_01015 [Candidatus Taylorbacteria bacterium RIFCSPHIGHO2_01_FULL_45_63]|uniref:Type II secretion system protein GspG C-terminal domain-containing protein n=1 Tax=Candidatus Taylorbacteria bacterium RIFCSPHIGHO2_02_FULL_45_35 TaxID=1802311 RepID=A0A1G2MPQ9_9BACT|nr:MAG: hypothetical protein A2836_01015 [Candidatus Taylorbacteria bacterium RIFCSPHIGHO2_01_FULL_45_63]OHA25877.1 MAG: hypothetical protein A3D56_01785 [Candidatus Taylorbacteria bacterium RIFCSPHIGHO2_02_FULL_45_35]OHA32367.1 MAG: hypothetical protein A3A22_03615 [Candidatus Taylorbacteria bacterium RIFCSPLOWO2_01_FULL_45_34b]
MLFLKQKKQAGAKRGFTLIELLVVISIIGLLSSIVLASLNTTRSRARDAKRLSEFRQIQSALELYYSKYGIYPAGSGNECGGWDGDGAGGDGQFIGALQTEGFMGAVRDPIGSSCRYQYIQRKSGAGYQLIMTSENNISNHPTCSLESPTYYCVEINYP